MSPQRNEENVYTKFVGTYIKVSTHQKLKDEANKKRWSMAQVIRLIFEEHTDTNGGI